MPSEMEVKLPHKLLTLLTLPTMLTLDTLLNDFISFGATNWECTGRSGYPINRHD